MGGTAVGSAAAVGSRVLVASMLVSLVATIRGGGGVTTTVGRTAVAATIEVAIGRGVFWGETAVGDWQPDKNNTSTAGNHHIPLSLNRLFLTAYCWHN
jgi:hypothetical protein